MKKIIGIYKITSPTNRVYIGQSIDIKNRFREYKIKKCKGQIRLYNSLMKHGVDKHTFQVIEECEESKLNERERHWQDYYDVLSKKGLNCVLTKTDDKSGAVTEETRLKMSLNRKGKLSGKDHPFYGKKRSKETCMNISQALINSKNKQNLKGENNPFYGKKHTQETKDKISKSNSGVNNYNYGKKGILSHNYGRKHFFSEERKNKMRGINNYFYGKHHSEETKKKISESKAGKQLLGKNPKAKKVIHVPSGIIYSCLKEVSILINVNYDALRHRVKKDNYEFQYVKEV